MLAVLVCPIVSVLFTLCCVAPSTPPTPLNEAKPQHANAPTPNIDANTDVQHVDKSPTIKDTIKSRILVTVLDPSSGTRGIFVTDESGSQITPLLVDGSDNAFPDWSPDKAFIVFQRSLDTHITSISVVNTNGGDIKRITNTASFYQFPAWSPDGKRIAFCQSRTASLGGNIVRENVFMMNADGSGTKQITFSTAQDTDWLPKWLPDGKRIAYLYTETGFYNIGIVDTTTLDRDKVNVQINVPANEWSIPWFDLSPDGKTIVFTNDVNRKAWNEDREIFSIDLATSEMKQLTKNEYQDDYPCWSPDGKRILFGRYDWKTYYGSPHPSGWDPLKDYTCDYCGLYIMNADGSNQTKIANTMWTVSPAEWR
jgi:Tol biopolymer transport system component